jgi:predicted RNA-binding protein YlxR (DUF448 family)
MAREPVRTCVGCRSRAPKAELVRIARTPEGVRADPEAVAPGRGAYVHPSVDCVEAALARGAIARALRMGDKGLDQQELARLQSRIEEALQGR